MHTCRHSAHKRVGAEGIHAVYHHTARTATAQWLHQSRWQCPYPLGVEAHPIDGIFHPIHHHGHGARCAETTYCHQYSHEVRNNHHSGLKAVLGALDKGIIYIHLLAHSSQQECHYHGQEQEIGEETRILLYLLLRELGKEIHHAAHKGYQAEQEGEQHAVHVDALLEAQCHHAHERCHGGGYQYGHKHIGGIGGAALCAIHHHTYGHQT